MAASAATASSPYRGRKGEAVVALVAAAALAWLVTHVEPLGWSGPPETEIVLDGARYRLDPEEVFELERVSVEHFAAGEHAARALVAAEIDARLDAVFARAHQRIPAFLDEYYSLRGEYARALASAGALVGLADPGELAKRAAAMLLPEEEWTDELARLEAAAAERLAGHRERLRAGWLAEVSARLEHRRVPAPLPETEDARPALVLDDWLSELAAHEQSAFAVRQTIGAATAIGAGALAPALARAAGFRAGRAAAARGAARGGARVGAAAGRVGPAAVGGAAVCAPGGPVAAICAVLAGAGAWLASDWALVRLDEALHRDDLERTLDAALGELRVRAEAELAAAYDELLAREQAHVESEIRRTFVPAAAGRERAPSVPWRDYEP